MSLKSKTSYWESGDDWYAPDNIRCAPFTEKVRRRLTTSVGATATASAASAPSFSSLTLQKCAQLPLQRRLNYKTIYQNLADIYEDISDAQGAVTESVAEGDAQKENDAKWILANDPNIYTHKKNLWNDLFETILKRGDLKKFSMVPPNLLKSLEILVRNPVFVVYPNGFFVGPSTIPQADSGSAGASGSAGISLPMRGLFTYIQRKSSESNKTSWNWSGKKMTLKEYNELRQKNPNVFDKKNKYIMAFDRDTAGERVGEFFIDPTDKDGNPQISNPFCFANEPLKGSISNLEICPSSRITICKNVEPFDELFLHYGKDYAREYEVGTPCVARDGSTCLSDPGPDFSDDDDDDDDSDTPASATSGVRRDKFQFSDSDVGAIDIVDEA